MTTTTHHVNSTSDSRVLMAFARGLLVLFGAVGLAGATYFTFFATDAEGGVSTGFDWFIAVWKLVVSVGMILVAVWPRMERGRRIGLALGLVLADLMFGAIKIVGYDETESLAFSGASLALFGLLLFLRHRTSRA
jgi:hypothetical protein